MLFADQNRKVSEWFKELAWKASIWVTVSRVRIPSFLLRNPNLSYFQGLGFSLKNYIQNTVFLIILLQKYYIFDSSVIQII